MSGTTQGKSREDQIKEIKQKQKDAKDDWAKGSQVLLALDKDIWHSIKNQASIKKTKWFQSSSNIGPKLVKVKNDAEKFSSQMNLSNFKSLKKNLEDLQKECKEFWGKHKDAQQDTSVKNALDIYAAACTQGLKALEKIQPSMPLLDKLDAKKAVNDTAAAIGI